MTDAPATPLRLAVIVGSNREGRFAPVVADWFTARAQEHGGWQVDVVDLADTALPAGTVWPGVSDQESVARFAGLVDAADAYVVVTPEYNHSFPAVLKHAIDLLRDEWRAKAVGFVSYGGMGGGLRAVEQLRLVFAELHAVTVRDSVSFHNAWERFDENGEPADAAGCAGAAKSMLDQLHWWARTLSEARRSRPYTV
ncbi:MAG TPA: NAD(P)H-dependent oxidoreductase [Yinghuangia sp.]|uniref:NADPH-dependent FMN reductase n=1 Tax=Yinghuangia sp. YIM S10712 TaxID=3436930 RepID=UPI002D018EC3|nr:NAD(P)H-dependent oxidoreductase [Yinghuangia sp.]